VTRPHHRLPVVCAVIMLSLPLARAAAQEPAVPVTFGWTACAVEDADGKPCAPAVKYEIYLQKGGALEELVATVSDTFYTLQAEVGVLQRVRVVGYDEGGRASPASPWSDPVYFDTDRSSPDEHTPPAQPALRPNYPNPFNPETRIAYGVPSDTPAGARMALEIFTLRGERIRSFPVETVPGWHEVTWDGRDDRGRMQSTGTYVTRYVCGDRVEIGKMTMVK